MREQRSASMPSYGIFRILHCMQHAQHLLLFETRLGLSTYSGTVPADSLFASLSRAVPKQLICLRVGVDSCAFHCFLRIEVIVELLELGYSYLHLGASMLSSSSIDEHRPQFLKDSGPYLGSRS